MQFSPTLRVPSCTELTNTVMIWWKEFPTRKWNHTNFFRRDTLTDILNRPWLWKCLGEVKSYGIYEAWTIPWVIIVCDDNGDISYCACECPAGYASLMNYDTTFLPCTQVIVILQFLMKISTIYKCPFLIMK